ncbi:MAG: 3-oxoacyl-ACP reductase [Halobacteriovoraceae bacterium]|nr:3-oxoacyl-ACP reductase [Halobacteriovoraceae bacterium]|tara:strand:- start:1161 stop:1874 length:714 start_codon:yes stop_codon:yes gene_type:complete
MTKRVFVTGGAAGIGLATVKKFWNEGAELVVMDIPAQADTELAGMERLTYLQTDITSADGQKMIAEEMARGIDVLVNNAGITRDASVLKMTDDMFDQVINVNLKAVWKLSQMAISEMKAKGTKGAILNAASVVAHYGNFGQTNYVSSKAGVIGLTKTLAKEVGKYGIRVNAIAPGFIMTEMVKKMPENVIGMMEEKTPLKTLGQPEDIANGYAFLASDSARFITGTCLNIDGGIVIG